MNTPGHDSPALPDVPGIPDIADIAVPPAHRRVEPPAPDRDCGGPWARALVLTGLVAAVIVVRLCYLSPSTNMWDSVDYLYRIERFTTEGFQRFGTIEYGHPLYIWLAGVVSLVCGGRGEPSAPLFGAQLLGILATASSLVPLYWTARHFLARPGWALMTTAFYAMVPLTWWWSGEIMSDATGVAFMLWIVGWLLRWVERGATWRLALACTLLGTAPLVRVSTLMVTPVFVAWLIVGLVRQRPRTGWLALVLIPLPVLAAVALQMLRGQEGSFLSYFRLLEPTVVATTTAASGEQWLKVLRHYQNALGPVVLGVAGLGLAVLLARRPSGFFFALLWVLPVLVFQVTKDELQIRYALPVMPLAALALAAPLARLATSVSGKNVAAVLAGGLAALLVYHAWPNVRALHERTSTLDAVAAWYAANTPTEAVIVAQPEFNHVAVLAGRDAIRLDPGQHRKQVPGERISRYPPLDLAAATAAIDEALRAGRPVFTSDLMKTPDFHALGRRFRLELSHTLDSREAGLRNGYEPGFESLGPSFRRHRDVHFYRVGRRGR